MYNGRTYNRVLCTTEGLTIGYYVQQKEGLIIWVLCTTEGLIIGYYVQRKDLQ